MNRQRLRKHTLSLCIATAAAGVCTVADAAFFQIQENSVSSLGNANAGVTAAAEDASTVWYNPAGMTHVGNSQVVIGGHLILPKFDVVDVDASAITGSPISGGGGGAGENALVPNFYYVRKINDGMTFGLGVNAPYGLATDYDDDWAGRYHADRSEIRTLNINPALAFKLSDQFSLGVGFNFQFVEATLSQAVDFATICTIAAAGAFSGACGAGAGFNPNSNPNDGHAEVTADDTAFGYNVGALWQFGAGTRLGLAYRSKMEYDVEGDLDLDVPGNVPAPLVAAGGFSNSDAAASVTLPSTLSISVFQRINSTWTVMGDITRTGWSDLPELRIQFDSAQPDSVVTLGLEDVNRYSVGATYAPGGAWIFRTGVALDESPTPNRDLRTPRLPDADRTWLAFGAGYKTSNSFGIDLAFVHIMVDDSQVSKTVADAENTTRGNLSADYEGSVNILSVQGNWNF